MGPRCSRRPTVDADQFDDGAHLDPAIDGVSLLQRNFTYIDTDGRVDGIRAYGLGTRTGHVGYALIVRSTSPTAPTRS